MRGRYEGMWNVVRFNWPKYALGLLVAAVSAAMAWITAGGTSVVLTTIAVLSLFALLLPLIASHIIYDRSNLYGLPWLDGIGSAWAGTMLNINAGFDETSPLIRRRFGHCTLEVADFHDPARHTEPSIARARRAYAPFPGTRSVSTTRLPFADGSIDLALAFLSLHEVRDAEERIHFLSEVHRTLKRDGRLIVTEHLRDLPNLIAFNIGFFHFHPKEAWLDAFRSAGFIVERMERVTPFITTFVLRPL